MLPAIALLLALLPPQANPSSPPQSSTPRPGLTTPVQSDNHLPKNCSPPSISYQVEPEFTLEAKKAKVLGAIILVGLIVDVQGNPVNVHIAKSLASTVKKKQQAVALTLDQRAVDAVKQYRFKPAICNGRPVPVELNVEVNFQIF